MFQSATTRPRTIALARPPTVSTLRWSGRERRDADVAVAALSQQLTLQTFGEPIAVPVLAPATLPDEDMLQRWVVENPDDIARLTNSQAVAQTALFIDQRRDSLRTCEAFPTELRPQLADLRVASGRSVDHFADR